MIIWIVVYGLYMFSLKGEGRGMISEGDKHLDLCLSPGLYLGV